MSHFSIASLQLELAAHDNRYVIQKEIERTLRVFPWIDLILLPELATFGPSTANAEQQPSDTERFYCDLAKSLGIWIVPGSMFIDTGDGVFNTTPVINPQGEIVTRYQKIYPFLPYEQGVTPGSDFVVFDVPDKGRIGISICYDQWFPEVTRTLAAMGAEVILCPTMTGTIDRDIELAIARTNAVVGQCYFFNINNAGELGVGRSIVLGPDGAILHQAAHGREVMPIEVDFDHVKRVRERGLNGLGQTLKSFRDNPVEYKLYNKNEALSKSAFTDLNELKVPE